MIRDSAIYRTAQNSLFTVGCRRINCKISVKISNFVKAAPCEFQTCTQFYASRTLNSFSGISRSSKQGSSFRRRPSSLCFVWLHRDSGRQSKAVLANALRHEPRAEFADISCIDGRIRVIAAAINGEQVSKSRYEIASSKQNAVAILRMPTKKGGKKEDSARTCGAGRARPR